MYDDTFLSCRRRLDTQKHVLEEPGYFLVTYLKYKTKHSGASLDFGH